MPFRLRSTAHMIPSYISVLLVACDSKESIVERCVQYASLSVPTRGVPITAAVPAFR